MSCLNKIRVCSLLENEFIMIINKIGLGGLTDAINCPEPLLRVTLS